MLTNQMQYALLKCASKVEQIEFLKKYIHIEGACCWHAKNLWTLENGSDNNTLEDDPNILIVTNNDLRILRTHWYWI